MIVTERDVQLAVIFHALNRMRHVWAVPNSNNLLSAEADVVSCNKDTLLYEWEIKVSPSDYKKDFEKPKHEQMAQLWETRESGNPVSRPWMPSFFYFVTTFEITPPDYAGWYHVVSESPYPDFDGMTLNIVHKKRAPKLHTCVRTDVDRIAATSLAYRLMQERWRTFKGDNR